MEISLLSDTFTTLTTKHIHKLSLTFSNLQIQSLLIPKDAIAPPVIKPRTAPKKLARKRCRIKRSSKTDSGGGGYDGEYGDGFFDGGDGPFGGGSGGGGGGDSGGGFNWDDDTVPRGPSDPAFDFVYEVLCWIVLSNCLHFAFKKVVRTILADGGEREKVSIPIC